MTPAIVIGRGGSKGFPNKNSIKVLGKELLRYPIRAATYCEMIDYVFFSTDSKELADIAKKDNCYVINRPDRLATDNALAEDVFIHAYYKIKYIEKYSIGDYIALLFANAPCITSSMIDKMYDEILSDPTADSICTVSKYNMFSVHRARMVYRNQLLNTINSPQVNCDRNSGGDFYFYDCSCAIVKIDVLKNIKNQPPPQPWLGNRILPYVQEIPALDLDYEWQLGQIEYWLKNNKE